MHCILSLFTGPLVMSFGLGRRGRGGERSELGDAEGRVEKEWDESRGGRRRVRVKEKEGEEEEEEEEEWVGKGGEKDDEVAKTS